MKQIDYECLMNQNSFCKIFIPKLLVSNRKFCLSLWIQNER